MKFHCPWVDPGRPIPEWLERDRGRADLSPTQRRSRDYYLKLWEATPLWETRARIASVYRRAAELRAAGFSVEVDHVVPLNHPEVCGLHTVANLQIISRRENAAKSNNDYPGQSQRQLPLLPDSTPQLEFAF